MDKLFQLYHNQVLTGKDEQDLFRKFFSSETNRSNVGAFVDLIMLQHQLKDDNVANGLRCEANMLYKDRNFTKSLHRYTLALCNATPESEAYGLILANRSAVFFMTNRFLECLSDIERCLSTNCPEATKIKVYIRKIKCCYRTNLYEYERVVLDALDYLNKCTTISDKSTFESEITSYRDKTPSRSVPEPLVNEEIPPVKDGFNDSFLYASKSIALRYDKQRGRHVRSSTLINPGDVLFIEKPFIFAPIFKITYNELHMNKCYNCLRTVCKYCTKCIFCNDTCRSTSWNEFHKWECRGLRSGLWYYIGIAFPALRALLRGVSTGLVIPGDDYASDTIKYGNKENNYLYFSKLVTNIEKMKNILPQVLCAATVVIYLEKYTDFFPWLLKQPFSPKQTSNDLILYIGALLVRHIAQLECNSSVVKHTDVDSEDDSVACAIYPSVSMMNHSCKPNITISYERDLAIVRAAETIQPGEEVFNCYGIDYRCMDRNSRQERCLRFYYFKCECRVCMIENI